ncbi:hypothetical protein V7S43_011081 [Phytophthora oleae]|uniref:Uncharacterized protein n=1 Tax=Phytophthora oleae TaxID=2107226 RepID=A0ABD3FB59_9STRA
MARGRKRTPGGAGRRPAGYLRDCETFKKNLNVINFFKAKGDMQLTLDDFYSHLIPSKRDTKRKRIYEWEKDRAHIESMAASSITASLKSDRKAGTATTLSTTGEEGLVE